MEWHGLLSVCLLFTLSFFLFLCSICSFYFVIFCDGHLNADLRHGWEWDTHTHTHTPHAGRQTNQTNKQIGTLHKCHLHWDEIEMGLVGTLLMVYRFSFLFLPSSFSFRVCFCFPIALLFYCFAFAFSCFRSPLAQTMEGMDSGSLDLWIHPHGYRGKFGWWEQKILEHRTLDNWTAHRHRMLFGALGWDSVGSLLGLG